VEQVEEYEEEEVLSPEAAAVDMTPFKPQKPVDWNDAEDGVWEPPEEYGACCSRYPFLLRLFCCRFCFPASLHRGGGEGGTGLWRGRESGAAQGDGG
jgi:hypothetical protein